MRSEENPLDLNNLPEDFTRDEKQTSECTSSSPEMYRKKKSGAKEEKDEPSKVYECRFCSLKFCKSQALGGHMNRHRQERETETLNKARQLVFTNDLAPTHLGFVASGGSAGQPHAGDGGVGGLPIIQQGGYHSATDPNLKFRSFYPTTRLFPGSSGLIPQHAPPPTQPRPPPPFIYASSQRLIQQFAPPAAATNDYLLGHVLNSPAFAATSTEGNYTCIGAPVPVGHKFANGGGGSFMELALHSQKNWGRR